MSLEEDVESSPKFGTQWNSERTADKQSLSGFLSDLITDTQAHKSTESWKQNSGISTVVSMGICMEPRTCLGS